MNTRDAISEFLFVRDEPAPVDLVLVLGAPSPSAIEPAITLYHQGLTRRIVITGKGPDSAAVPEWAVFSRHALEAGIPESVLLIEREATNTRENFLFTEPLIAREIGWSRIASIAITTKPFHARRTLMTARKVFPGHVRVLMLPPRHPGDLQADNWWRTPIGRDRIFGEIKRIGEYALRDHLSDA